MSDIQAALSSLHDSLNILFFRLDSTDPRGVRVSKIMLRIGEVKQAIGLVPSPVAAATAFPLSGSVSVVDAGDGPAVDRVLDDIAQFLDGLWPGEAGRR